MSVYRARKGDEELWWWVAVTPICAAGAIICALLYDIAHMGDEPKHHADVSVADACSVQPAPLGGQQGGSDVRGRTPAEGGGPQITKDATAMRDGTESLLIRESLRLAREADETVLPTAEGLFLRTADWWNQDEFLASAKAKTLVDAIGLPTREDCEEAFRNAAVADALAELSACEMTLIELDLHAQGAKSAELDASREGQRAVFFALERKLMATLDSVGPYRSWAEMNEAFREWMAEE